MLTAFIDHVRRDPSPVVAYGDHPMSLDPSESPRPRGLLTATAIAALVMGIGGLGIALFAAAAFFALMALIMLSVAIAYFIHWNGKGLALHWSFLIVFGGYLLLAALLAFVGVRKVKKVRAPQKAIAQANETKAILKRD